MRALLHLSMVVLVAAGCSKREPSPTAASSTTVSTPAVVSAVSPAIASTSPAPIAKPGERQATTPEKLLFAWNVALNRRAVAELQPFYGPSVLFYGRRITRAQVLDAKHSAFQKTPDFQQRIRSVRISRGPSGYVVRFEKQSGASLEQTVNARLVLEARDGKLEIVEESDEVTDRRLANPEPETCSDAVIRIADGQPIIQADRARVAREYPDVNPGGMSFDVEEHRDRASLAFGYFHPERFETRWTGDAADGKLTLRDNLTTQLLPLTRAQEQLIQRLCPGPSEAIPP